MKRLLVSYSAPNSGAIWLGASYLAVASSLAPVIDAMSQQLLHTLPILFIVWARYFIHSLFMAILLFKYQEKSYGSVVTQIFRGVLQLISTLLLLAALKHLDLPTALTIVFLAPVMNIIYQWIGPNPHRDPLLIILALISLGGVIYAYMPTISGKYAEGMLYALGSSIALAGYTEITSHLGKINPAVNSFFASLPSAVLLLPFIVFIGLTNTDFLAKLNQNNALYKLVAIGLISGLLHIMVAKAYKLSKSSIISPIGYFEIPSALFISSVFLKGILTWNSIFGSVIILICGVLITMRIQYLQREEI